MQLPIETKSNEDITEGSMICIICNNEYLIRDGVPRMYLPDNEIIAISNNSMFSEFILTPENLDKRIKSSKPLKSSSFFTNKKITKYLLGLGWILLLFSIPILFLSYFNFNGAMTNKVYLLVAYLLIFISVTFFVIDYLRYRTRAEIKYLTNLHKLKELSDIQKLSEYDIRDSNKDREENFKNDFERQRDWVAYKGKNISSTLNNYNFKVKTALNVGCGGALHKSVSKPYFDKGYEMIGIDINEEYLEQFSQIFNTDVVQANSMALPFRKNSFDLINFTDVVEHLHHPFLGLGEAQRVLKLGGVIILTTNNRCVVSPRCINPLVFVEKIIGLHYESVLPRRNILERWMDFDFYHTEFSKNEITRLLRAAGFEILSLETQFPFKDKLNKVFKYFPALRFMCSEFMIIGKKKISH